jgi:YegS/Rv2252/BmrU family lipid kinase
MLLIVNRKAGAGKAAAAVGEIETHLARRALDYRVAYTDHPGHAIELAREASHNGTSLIVAVGGDGTIHEIVNGMIENDEAIQPQATLGVIAAGTGCDFVKTFGIPAMPPHAVAHLDGPDRFPIDIGKMTFTVNGEEQTRYFPNIAEVGFGASVVKRANRLPRWMGPAVYPAAFWLTLRGHQPTEVKVDLVDRTYEGRMNNLVVANCQFFGGGMKIAPRAAPTDGLLDVQIEHARKSEAIAILPKIYKGTHLPHDDIMEAKRAKVSISSQEPLLVEADGEVLGETPARFEVLRDALRLKV